jgi:hypothetical protein
MSTASYLWIFSYICLRGFGLAARRLSRRRVHPNGTQPKWWRLGAQRPGRVMKGESRTCDVLIFMCSIDVRWILVILYTCDVWHVIVVMLHTCDFWLVWWLVQWYVMLDCYICGKSLYICMMLFLYACFGGLPAREVDKIGNFVF